MFFISPNKYIKKYINKKKIEPKDIKRKTYFSKKNM